MHGSIVWVFILFLTASSLMFVKPILAETTTSVPEFTLKFVGQPYYVPSTNSTDPYTGANVTKSGYYIANGTIELSIENQPFNSFNGTYSLYYNVRTKGHFEQDNWTTLYYYNYFDTNLPMNRLPSSSSNNTVVNYPANYPPNAQVDFQLQAIVYNTSQVWVLKFPYGGEYVREYTIYAASDWSHSQTITIPDTSTPSPTPNTTQTPSPTPSPSIPELPTWIILTLVLIVTLSTALMIRKKTTKFLIWLES